MKHKASLEFSKVNEYIYLGTNSCCQVHFDKGLLDLGVAADISLEEEKLDTPFGVDYFLWLPTPDKDAPTQDKLEIGVKFMDDLIEKKIKLYTHCKNGHGRSPTLVVAYFIYKGMGVKEAMDFVKSMRPEIHLDKKQIVVLKNFKLKKYE